MKGCHLFFVCQPALSSCISGSDFLHLPELLYPFLKTQQVSCCIIAFWSIHVSRQKYYFRLFHCDIQLNISIHFSLFPRKLNEEQQGGSNTERMIKVSANSNCILAHGLCLCSQSKILTSQPLLMSTVANIACP